MAMILQFPTSRTPLARMVGSLGRNQLANLIQVAIDALDTLDGDPDLEDEPHEDDDPSGERSPILRMLPVYGLDQSRGPLNECEAFAEHLEEIRR